jgi:hypothetical protein
MHEEFCDTITEPADLAKARVSSKLGGFEENR